MYKLNIPRILLLVSLGILLSSIPASWVVVLAVGFKKSLSVVLVGQTITFIVFNVWFISAVIGFLVLFALGFLTMTYCFEFTNTTVKFIINDELHKVRWYHAVLLLPAVFVALPIYTPIILFFSVWIPIFAIYDMLKQNSYIENFIARVTQPILQTTKTDSTKPREF